MKNKNNCRFLTVNELNDHFGIKPSLIYWWLREKKIIHYKVGKKVLIKELDFLTFLEAHRQEVFDFDEEI